MRLLLVQDDDVPGTALHKGLTRLGHAVDWVHKGRDMETATRTHDYAGIVLDLDLRDMAGAALLALARTCDPGIPVVVMTDRGDTQDRVAMLDIGADDYMTKPVEVEELAARLRAVLRRSKASVGASNDLQHGPLKLFPARRLATWNGTPVALTNKEYRVLEALLRKRNQVLTRAQLEEALYGWGEEIGSNAVEVYIHYLRRKFGAAVILTIRGVGYQLGSLELQPR